MKYPTPAIVCRFDSVSHLRGKQRTYENIKAAVLSEDVHKEYKIGGVRITGSIETDVFVPASNKWNTYRHLWVYVDGNVVCAWNWHYLTVSIDDPVSNKLDGGNSDELLYIPGAWVTSALAMQPKAEQARSGIARNADIAERDRLARRLLVGMQI